MFFLLRCAFWICVVLALLPLGTPQPGSKDSAVGALDALSAAGAAVSDMGQFCDRQPEACQIGGKAAVAFGQRAQAGAKVLYEFISEKMAPSETGSVSAQKGPKALPSQHTLNPSDLEPGWRGPAPRPEAPAKRPG
ncbi:MAG: DUF5330 domain-containing protein [Pseudorhodoplanes sp.]